MLKNKYLKLLLLQVLAFNIALLLFNIMSNYLNGTQKRTSPEENMFKVSGNDPISDTLTLQKKMYPDFSHCSTKSLKSKYIQWGNYRVLQNYVKATETFLCNESVTYATHGQLGFLHNLVEIASRWQGPISVAVYAPSESFQKTLDVIFHLRECGHNEVKKLVTFHIFFDSDRMPNVIPKPNELLNPNINCSIKLHDIDYWNSSHHLNEFLYPVNVARNVAKSNSATYFYFTSDIELYPSLNIIPELLRENKQEPGLDERSQKLMGKKFNSYCNGPKILHKIKEYHKNIVILRSL
ncbi:Beta-1,4-glucuronyltransferase 1 [Armadillidium vulgare]|nr:Beta-1,4-glucuronyltransferase 1 [Armadillidium vulgare]